MSKSTIVYAEGKRTRFKSGLSLVTIFVVASVLLLAWRADVFRDHSFIRIPDFVVPAMVGCIVLTPVILWFVRSTLGIQIRNQNTPTSWKIPNTATLLLILFLCVGGFVIALRSKKDGASIGNDVQFLEESAQSGVRFVHAKPIFDPRVSNIMPWLSAVGASASAADYDNSGRTSVFLTNSNFNSQDALFRNDGTRKGIPHFIDVTEESGLRDINKDGVSMAAAWGDYDNDGFPDLYIVRAGGGNLLFHNVPVLDDKGNAVIGPEGVARRKFVNLTRESNTGSVGYGVGALWFDYDRDGRLDLVVADYFASVYSPRIFGSTAAEVGREPLDLWHLKDTRFMPDSFNNARNGGGVMVFHNEGDGKFSEVHGSLGLRHTGFALAIGAADLNNDGWPDLYVANDFGPDDLYINSRTEAGDRIFSRVEGGFTADKIGRDTKKGMNVDFGDVDHDRSLAI